jgi:hypothetical protein
MGKSIKKKWLWAFGGVLLLIGAVVVFELVSTRGRTQVQVNILQNKEIIHQSTFAEPPQFAIWLENTKTHKCQTVFVTHRAGIGDWEGKSNVPVALPRWFELFKVKGKENSEVKQEFPLTVTGATPKDDYFSIRAEVKPESQWICWIEMNLAGDFNDFFPEHSKESMEVDEFSNGQPALLYRAEFTAKEGSKFNFELAGQSIWKDGETKIEAVNEGVTTAKEVFSKMNIEIIRPKPKLIGKNEIKNDQTDALSKR